MDSSYILKRPLGMFEKNQVAKQLTKGYASVTLTAELHHPPRSDSTITSTNFYKLRLKSALSLLIRKHPMLRLSLLDADKSSARFVQLCRLHLDDLIIVTDQDRFWDQEIQEHIITEECQHEYDLFALKPFWRLRVSCHADVVDRCSITLSVQHVIADGLSTTTLWKDMLQFLNCNSGDADMAIKSTDDGSFFFDTGDDCAVPLPIEDRNGPKDTTISTNDSMPLDGWQGDFPAPDGETLDTVLHLAKVGGKTWSSLLGKAKTNGVSAHAVVYAAYLLSWVSVYPNQSVKTATAINCRTYCLPPIPDDELGIFFGRYECGWPLDKLDLVLNAGTNPFWPLAKMYHDLIQENKLLTCQRSLLMGDSLSIYPDDYCDVWYNSRKNFKMGRSGGLNISDLGRFNYTNGDGDLWKLDHLWFAQSAHFYATILAVNVVTANGIMHAAITWQRGSVLENKALSFIDLFISRLEKESLE